MVPTKSKMNHEAQNQGDQAKAVKNKDKSNTDVTINLDLFRKSPKEANIRLPANDPRPAPSSKRPDPAAPVFNTSCANAGMMFRYDTVKNAKIMVIAITVYTIGVSLMQLNPSRRSWEIEESPGFELGARPFISHKNITLAKYNPALIVRADPIPINSMIPPANAGPKI
tara:strand:- start:239 stop:745 length:507 start_codon:yes stop_codon:yes gene_type:complete